jgi:SAM-dependent methyltransferase
VDYEPTAYRGSAAHYLRGRPPYSRELAKVLRAELGLDGSGRLLDVGCGPGVLAVELAEEFGDVIGIDPDAAMLDEARRHAAERAVTNARWMNARAEEIDTLDVGPLRAATFGQSFHWTDREVVAESIYDLLEPGGAIVLITHDIDARAAPSGPGHPPIPHDDVRDIIRRYLGPQSRFGSGVRPDLSDRYEDALARTRFGQPRFVHAPGRQDIVQDVDGVVSNYLSTSFAAPHLFGDRLDEFVAEVRALLVRRSAAGWFWDWPGDTVMLIGSKG